MAYLGKGYAMTFPEVSARRPRPRIIDLIVMVAIAALPAAAVAPPRAPETAGLALIMLGVGALLWGLSGLAGRARWIDSLALPALFSLTCAYIVLCCVAFVSEPRAAALILAAQVAALLYASFRG